MTNEIKEIIDYLKEGKIFLNSNECKILLDYITNLQEEKENAVECLKYYEEKHFIKPAIDNTKLTIELYNAYSKEINDLQQRIDKAVEVIDLITPELWNISNKMTYRLKDVKNILRGDDNEND